MRFCCSTASRRRYWRVEPKALRALRGTEAERPRERKEFNESETKKKRERSCGCLCRWFIINHRRELINKKTRNNFFRRDVVPKRN